MTKTKTGKTVNLEVDKTCVRDLEDHGWIEAEHNGTTINAEWP
jgi:hypothetical protein